MKSIYLRNFLATALLVFFSFAIIGTAFFFLGRSYLMSSTRERMISSADEVVRSALALSKQESLSSWNLSHRAIYSSVIRTVLYCPVPIWLCIAQSIRASSLTPRSYRP